MPRIVSGQADGVMAAQGSLKPLVMVRIHVGLPIPSKSPRVIIPPRVIDSELPRLGQPFDPTLAGPTDPGRPSSRLVACRLALTRRHGAGILRGRPLDTDPNDGAGPLGWPVIMRMPPRQNSAPEGSRGLFEERYVGVGTERGGTDVCRRGVGPISDRLGPRGPQGGLKGARQASPDYFTASILVTASSPCSLSRLPVTLTFLVWLQISPWKPLETSPVSL